MSASLPEDDPKAAPPRKVRPLERALVEGVDYYREGPYTVFTEYYLRERGYCCESGCRHCPYGFGPEGLKRKMRGR
jgi:hypothetical protein